MTLPPQLESALATLAGSIDTLPGVDDELRARWRDGVPGDLPRDVRKAADELNAIITSLLSVESARDLASLFSTPHADLLALWCSASTWRVDVSFLPLLSAAKGDPRVAGIARRRVVEGPLLDALRCAPLIGEGRELASEENVEACARLEILVWEAGATALQVPELGPWIWGSAETFEQLVQEPARGALRGRVLAARRLEIAADGMPQDTSPELIGRTLQVLQPLLFHPEPLVWVAAARALGRLTGTLEQLEGMLLDWVMGDSKVLRQRAITAFASLRQSRLRMYAGQLQAIIVAPDEEGWVLAAVAAATPYLFFEHNDLWNRLCKRILAGDGGAVAARALARGLASLWRRGLRQFEIDSPLRALRERARRIRTESLDDARRWLEVIAVTDAIDGAERDPLDLELGLENLVRVAAQYDDEEADARAARFAGSVAQAFGDAHRIALGTDRLRVRAAAMNALEGCARALALRLWTPLLATSTFGDRVEAPDLSETWKSLARAPAEILDLVRETRANDGKDPRASASLEVLAIRVGGYALDACGDGDLGPGRGPTAHDTCLWLRKLEALGTREIPASLQGALSTLFWRLVDTTRGTALGETDDVRWLGPFAAWWALVIDRPQMLLQLANALPIMEEGALARCCEHAETLRTALSTDLPNGEWGPQADAILAELHAEDTELARALANLAQALKDFGAAASNKPNIEELCLQLVLAGDRLHGALADPVKALHPATEASAADSLTRSATENAPRVSALVARAIRARDLSMLDVWFASLGPVASALLEEAVKGAMKRSPPPPPQKKQQEAKLIEGYELLKPLGEGGIGSVWLVRKPGADRYFVLKIPKADALANATETERAGILASFVEEAKALAGLYHPNVANIIDRGVSAGVPFLVLEYLIGADLKQYSSAHPMSLFELRTVVLESCSGLDALHRAGLVHRDIKPANIWLRLPLAGGERFDPGKHRDPAHVQPLSSVVIDFGMVRATRVGADAAGRFVAGTPGYIAPEQVLDPVELDPRSDIYALAGTIYNVTTGRTFFDEIENSRDRILAHMRRDPLEDPERLRGYPAAIAKLMRAATARDPADRPSPMEFGRAFVSSL